MWSEAKIVSLYTDTIFRNSVLPFNSSRTLLGFPTSCRLERLVAPHPNFHTLSPFLIWLGKIFGHHFQYFHTLTMFLWIRQDFWFTIFMPPTISLDLCIQYAKRETPQINFPMPSIFVWPSLGKQWYCAEYFKIHWRSQTVPRKLRHTLINPKLHLGEIFRRNSRRKSWFFLCLLWKFSDQVLCQTSLQTTKLVFLRAQLLRLMILNKKSEVKFIILLKRKVWWFHCS